MYREFTDDAQSFLLNVSLLYPGITAITSCACDARLNPFITERFHSIHCMHWWHHCTHCSDGAVSSIRVEAMHTACDWLLERMKTIQIKQWSGWILTWGSQDIIWLTWISWIQLQIKKKCPQKNASVYRMIQRILTTFLRLTETAGTRLQRCPNSQF